MYPRSAWTSNEGLRDKRILGGGFYQSIRLTLLTCRLAGLLPMSGLLNNTSKFTKCTWKSPFSVIQIPALLIQTAFVLFLVIHLGATGFTTQKLTTFVFFCNVLSGNICLIRLCRKWQTAINEIETIEIKLPPSRYARPTWSELQVYYTRITRLANIVDDMFSPVVFIAVFAHIFFISLMTFYILNKLTRDNFFTYTDCVEKHRFDWEVVLYSTCSFVFAVSKLSFTSFIAAELHTASREALNALYTAPTNTYGIEMQRLLTQIYNTDVHLSGIWFRITRETILTMFGTIMTYELVLLQI